jgi:DNA-binding NtrC family response regulator
MSMARILIVDDEKNILSTLRKALEFFEYEIDEAEDGTTACNMITQNSYDCILLDMRLPDIDGLEILRRLSPANVIMITAHGTVDNAVEAMKLGCTDFIRKPFDLDTVRDAVRLVLERQQLSYEQSIRYESLMQLAKLEVASRNYSKAREKVLAALEAKPDSPEAYNYLGAMEEILGNLSQALKAYQTAQGLDPSYEPARDNLNRIRSLDNAIGIILGKDK